MAVKGTIPIGTAFLVAAGSANNPYACLPKTLILCDEWTPAQVKVLLSQDGRGNWGFLLCGDLDRERRVIWVRGGKGHIVPIAFSRCFSTLLIRSPGADVAQCLLGDTYRQTPMRRANGDDPVAVQLRQEVNFRCPIQGCGRAILTYHHFDPEWAEREHNEPAGMIALCSICHGKAGQWTKQQLRGFKSNPPRHSASAETLLWLESNVSPLFRIGGNYFVEVQWLVHGDRPILTQRRAPSGTILFSLDLRRQDGQSILKITDNTLAVEDLNFWDFRLTTHGNHMIVKPRAGQIALDLHFKRFTLDELESKMRTDGIERVPQEIPDRCRDSDGKVLLIDLRRAELFAYPNVSLSIRSGSIQAGIDGSLTLSSNYCCGSIHRISGP